MDFVVSVIILILTAIVCLPVFKSYRNKKAIEKCINNLPGDKIYPVFGTTLRALRTTRETYWERIKDRHQEFGPIFRAWLGNIPVVHVYKPEHAQIIFKSATNINKGLFYKILVPWLGNGLISGNGHHWRHHRKVITPAFHFKVLESYGEVFAKKGQYIAEFLNQFSGKGYFEITEYLTRMAIDIISETALGVNLNFMTNKQSEYAEAIIGYSSAAIQRMYNPALQSDFLYSFTKRGQESSRSLNYIHNFNEQIIQQRREYFSKHKNDMQKEDDYGRKQKMSFLDILLTQRENNNFKDKEIEEEINTFMFAGQDTTAVTISLTLMAVGNHPEVMKKIENELDTIFEGDLNSPITPQHVAKMEYLDRVVKEVLRCYNFVPYLGRQLSEDIEIDGVYVPKGVSVVISMNDLHHDPNHYPDPYKFDPDRFLPENVAARHPFAFVPFSAGPRNCIGQKFAMQNSKTLLAYIFRKYNIKCQEKPEDIKYYLEVVLRPQNGIHISVEPRHCE